MKSLDDQQPIARTVGRRVPPPLAVRFGGALLVSTCVCTAYGQPYPAKPLRMIVASSAGSNPDTVGRVFASGLGQVLGHQVIVDNRAGAGGNIGAEAAARAPADGYTLFLAHTNHSINTALYRKLSYDILNDFAHVTLVATSAFVVVVHPSVPARSLRDLLNIAGPGRASSTTPRPAPAAGPFSRRSISTGWRT